MAFGFVSISGHLFGHKRLHRKSAEKNALRHIQAESFRNIQRC